VLLRDDDAGLVPLWWWGRGLSGACWCCRGCSGLLSLVESAQQEWLCSGRKTLLSTAMVAAPGGVAFPVEGTFDGYHFLQHGDPRVKTQSFVNMQRRRHWRRTLFGGAVSRDPS
jgi:hypothetical protein